MSSMKDQTDQIIFMATVDRTNDNRSEETNGKQQQRNVSVSLLK